ncbi:MAG: flavin reductase family protein [Chthonomonadales bacterium]|nr:flavin reductase family protein [Chthonomonadales bacterium]
MPDADPAASDGFLHIDVADLSMAEAHRLLLHCVAPRPIAFTSTIAGDGAANLAPFSYFMAGGANPPSIAISPIMGRGGEPKDTLRNIRTTGEFVVNVVTHAMRDRMNAASMALPYGVSEWSRSGFTAAPCRHIRPPRVAESPLAMECRLFQVVPHGAGPLAANYVIGEVLAFHVAEAIMPEGVLDPRHVSYIARMGGDWYARVDGSTLFEMARSRPASGEER